MADDRFAGPINYLVFGFAAGATVGGGLELLLHRVDAGVVEILDLECVGRDETGRAVRLDLSELPVQAGLDLDAFTGVVSGILDADDLERIAEALQPGQFALAVVYEDRSLADVARAWIDVGGAELLAGGIDIEQLAAIVETEA